MKNLTQSLLEIADIFEALNAEYAVMGGVAVRIHGIPRPTHDVDFTVALARDSLSEFFDRAAEVGYTIAEPYRHGWVNQVAGMPLVKLRMYLDDHGIDIDIFLAESPFQSSLLSRRRREAIDGNAIWFVSPEDLILLKLVANRPRDLIDVQDILFTQGQLDEAYLRHWAAELGVTERLELALRDARGEADTASS